MRRGVTRGTAGWANALVVVFLMAALPGGMLPRAEGQDRGTLRARLLGDISNLDPAHTTTIHDQYILNNVYSGLVRMEPHTGKILPDLATRWEVSSDGLTYTFFLRRGVQWHKGFGEVTAEDVKYTLERVLDPQLKAVNRVYIESIKSVTVVDPYTVRITLSEPYSALLLALSYRPGRLVKKEAVERFGDQYRFNPVGTGPYLFERWARGREVVLTANEQYFGGAAKIKQVVFRVVADETVARLALERGEIDIAVIRDAESYKRFLEHPNLTLTERPGTGVRHLFLNTRKRPFDDVRVRRAVYHAINQDIIANVVLGRTHAPLRTPLSDAFGIPLEGLRFPEYNPVEARRLLKEAGVEGITVNLLTTELSPWPEVVPVIRDQLRAVGIQVQVTQLEHGAYTARRRSAGAAELDLVVLPTGRPPDPDLILPLLFHSNQNPPAGSNHAFYAGVDRLLEEARRTVDTRRRATLYTQIFQKIIDDVPAVPLFSLKVQVVMRKNVKGHLVGINNDFWLHSMSME